MKDYSKVNPEQPPSHVPFAATVIFDTRASFHPPHPILLDWLDPLTLIADAPMCAASCLRAPGYEQGHTEWVSCVRFSPSPSAPVIVSAGWDKLVKVWALSNCKLHTNLIGHTG